MRSPANANTNLHLDISLSAIVIYGVCIHTYMLVYEFDMCGRMWSLVSELVEAVSLMCAPNKRVRLESLSTFKLP